MKSRLFGAVGLMLLPAAAQSQAARVSPVIDSVVAREMSAKGIPGVVLVVVDRGGARYVKAYGVASTTGGEPLGTRHLLQVGSVTKGLTALLDLQLAATHRLDLDSPIRRYLPAVEASIGGLIIRDLLAQRSGLRDVPGGDGTDDEGELARYAASLPDSFVALPVGDAFSYSNVGYALAGAVGESATGRPFADALRAEILAPLGMTSSTMRPAEAARVAHAVGSVGPPGTIGTPVTVPDNDTRLWPAGYLWSNGEDMAWFLGALLSSDDGPLARGVIRAALTPAIEVPGQPNGASYGAGAFVDRFRGELSAWHPGSSTGFSALWRVLPDRGLGVAVLTNRDAVRLEPIVDAALVEVARAMGRPFAPAAVAVPVEAIGQLPTSSELQALAGVYEARFPLELRWREGRLWLTRFGTALPVTPLGTNRYAVRANDRMPAEVFRIMPGRERWPPYIQMFLWAFPRVRS